MSIYIRPNQQIKHERGRFAYNISFKQLPEKLVPFMTQFAIGRSGPGDSKSFREEGTGPGEEVGAGQDVDDDGVAVERRGGGERGVADGEVEEGVREAGVCADLEEDAGDLGRSKAAGEVRAEGGPPGGSSVVSYDFHGGEYDGGVIGIWRRV